MTSVLFVALLILGFGLLSLVGDAGVLSPTGQGPFPGIAAVVAATIGYASVTSSALRRRPVYPAALGAALGSYLLYVLVIGVASGLARTDASIALAASSRAAIGWVGAVVAGSAFVCCWFAIALVRTNARTPRWPWEGSDGEDE